MSIDQIADQPPLHPLDADRPIDAERASDVSSQVVGGQLPRDVVTGATTDTVEALLLSVGRGDQEAFFALQSRMAGLVRVNVRRVLRDATRSEAVTQETFADVLADALHFDPHRDSAETWLLARAHQHAMDGLRSVDAASAIVTDPRARRSTTTSAASQPPQAGPSGATSSGASPPDPRCGPANPSEDVPLPSKRPKAASWESPCSS